ncbi:MAG: hypothetical protein IJJ33_13585, partial [Victivallales bacterium]|nr:hypothetical protein [Victivallales bacterium]
PSGAFTWGLNAKNRFAPWKGATMQACRRIFNRIPNQVYNTHKKSLPGTGRSRQAFGDAERGYCISESLQDLTVSLAP